MCGRLQEQFFYGLLVNDIMMADVGNDEQMLAFVQFLDVDPGNLGCQLLFTAIILDESANLC